MSNHYIVLGVTLADAKKHPAYAGALGASTPRTVAHAGRPITGYVMTDAFAELCEQDTASGYTARQVLRAAMIDLAHGTPNRVVRPATLSVAANMVGGL